MGNLFKLIRLSLDGNQLSGAIPPELGSLVFLKILELGGNQLSGAIPPELGNLFKLSHLSLYGNQLSGAMPPELGNLANLGRLYLNANQLSGEMPPELGNLANLGWMNLDGNQLSGEIHPELGNLSKVIELHLGGNQLSGEIPPELGNLASLDWMDLDYNQLSGTIPPELGNLATLRGMSLRGNQLSGTIPPELGNLATLEFLDLTENKLTGEIPAELGNLANLEWLDFRNNELSGKIPTELGKLASLTGLHLYGNQLSGCVPSSLQDQLDRADNHLGGLPFCRRSDAPTQSSQQGKAPMMEYSRLEWVKERGKVICASRNDVPGFGYLDARGNNVGFDIDLCRAVAAAVLGDSNAIELRLITAAERGPTIQSGEVDMLVRTVTWTTSRDAQWGNYAQTMFYDGQGFMVNKSLGVDSALDLDGASVCVTQGTTTELNLQDFSDQNGLGIEALTFEDTDAVVAAYESGQCDAFTNDRSQLAALGTALQNRDDHVILPETISEEPLGPVVPHGDDQWFDIVKMVMSILIYAEAYGIGQGNVPSAATGDTRVDRLFGLEGGFGQQSLGLSQTLAQDIVMSVGNYGEIYDRHLGPSRINLPRKNGRNALWADAPCIDCPKGGQIYAAPLR